MNAKNAVLMAGFIGLMSMATTAPCRDFGKRPVQTSPQRIDWSTQSKIAGEIASRKGFAAERPTASDSSPVTAEDNRPGERALKLCLSRCVSPNEELALRSSVGNADLNDTVMAARTRKMAMGLNWKALPNLRISADYEKSMDGSLETAIVQAESVRARMQLTF